MNPFYFGTSTRRLFGVHSAARSGAPRGSIRAVLLCPPWGQEYLRAHRSMRQLADTLAAAGCDAMRFDYHGTGDSSGDMLDAGIVGWESDIEAAIDELKDVSGVGKVGLVGLRLGAALAARVASRRSRDVAALVLWDPVVSGNRYLEELFQLAESREHAAERPSKRSSDQGGGHELLGFALPESMTTAIREIELAPLANSWPDRTRLVVSQGGRSAEELRAVLVGTAAASHVAEIPGRSPWTETDQIMAGEVPVKLLRHVVDVLRDG